MTPELWVRRPCECNERELVGGTVRSPFDFSCPKCGGNGWVDERLDPERLVRDVWIVNERDTEVIVYQAHVTVASFLDALAQERT